MRVEGWGLRVYPSEGVEVVRIAAKDGSSAVPYLLEGVGSGSYTP